jgi:hypothetical protein
MLLVKIILRGGELMKNWLRCNYGGIIQVLIVWVLVGFSCFIVYRTGFADDATEKSSIVSTLEDTDLVINVDGVGKNVHLYYDTTTYDVYMGSVNGAPLNTSTVPTAYLDSTGLKPYKYNPDTKELYEDWTED